MIVISGNVVKSDIFIDEYKPDSIQRDILTIMNSSTARYEYDSLNQLQFELKLREAIINASKKLNDGDMSFKIFTKSTCNPDFWDRTDQGGFILKDSVTPSAAINDISVNSAKYGTECSTAIIIIYYQALLNIYNDKLFNELFPHIHLMNYHYINDIIKDAGYLRKQSDYLPGDRRYFVNPDVNPIKPEWQGENVIDLGNGLYFGHGIGIGNADKIIDKLNEYRIEGSEKTAYLLDGAGRLDFKDLSNRYYEFLSSSTT